MKTIYISITFILFILFTACTERLETSYEGKSDNFLVVHGEISTDTIAHTIKLSRTVDYNATESPAETGAIVSISDGINVFPLSESEPGIYKTESNVFGVEGREYTLSIQTTDGKKYSAVSKINRLTDIDSLAVKYEFFPFNGKSYHKVFFNGQEPAGTGDCYIWNLYTNGALYNDTLSKSQFQSDDLVDGQYVSNFDLYWFETTDLPSDTVLFTVEMVSIPKDYYLFITEVLSETVWRGGPFDPTPANVSTNIVGNGAVGFFYATQKKRKSLLYIVSQAVNSEE